MDRRPDTGGSEPTPPLRFEATVLPAAEGVTERTLDDLDLDRVPDVEQELRVIADATGLQRLVDGGFDVRLRATVPVRPLDPRLVATDDEVRAWFDARVREAGGPDAGNPS